MTNYLCGVKWFHRKKRKKKKISKSFEHCFLVKSNTDHSAKKKTKKNKQKCKCAEHYNNKWKCDSIKCSDALL